MSWLNFNDSLNNLKGQISTFANNVLADEIQDDSINTNEIEELKRVCTIQQEEITRLRRLTEHLNQGKTDSSFSNNEVNQSDTSWNWDLVEGTKNGEKKDDNNVISTTNLMKKINELENDKKELISNLELLDSDFQQNTEKLAKLKDQLQSDYNDLEEKFTLLQDQNAKLLETARSDRKQHDEIKSKYEQLLLASSSTSTSGVSACLKCNELLKQNEEAHVEIATLKEEIVLLKNNVSTLSKTFESSKSLNEDELKSFEEKCKLAQAENKILIAELQKCNESIVDYQKKIETDAENSKKAAFILEEYEQQVSDLKAEILAQNSNEAVKNELVQLKQDLEKLKDDKLHTHEKYINILTENIKKYADCDKPSDFRPARTEPDPQVCEFNNQVESILNLLWDLKSKNQRLENDLFDMKQEKTNLLTEKNHEIEKLLHNSEILSQEVITKSQTIKDYENECNALIKNNDLLINELEEYKSNSGLQTISESNEDNLLLLETQLENANKRIEELEVSVSKYESDSIIEKEEEDTVDELKTENLHLKESIAKLENEHQTNLEEKQRVLLAFEKLKTDLENTEYQYTEINVMMETLKEEIEVQRSKVEELVSQNIALEKINGEYERNSEDLRGELNLSREKLMLEEDNCKQLENQLRQLIEKLQNAKMHETSLKLQYDTTSKELTSMIEAKNALEMSLQNTLSTLSQCENKFATIQQENGNLTQISEEYKQKLCQLEAELAQAQKEKVEFVEVKLEEKPQAELNLILEERHKLKEDLESTNMKLAELLEEKKAATLILDNLKQELREISEERDQLKLETTNLVSTSTENSATLQKQIEELVASKTELTNVVITKHQENVTYHNEIQRLTQIINSELEKNRSYELQLQSIKAAPPVDADEIQKKNEELEKLTDQNGFLRQKCEVLAETLLQEQNKLQQLMVERSVPSEKEQSLSKKLERLQTHLIEVEDHYTQELLRAEEINKELQAKVNEIEEREKNSSTMYTSVSIRANQHVETLQHQLQLITNQRDELRKKMSDAEDNSNKQAAALANLQFVLEQFQKDKENDVLKETERIRRQIGMEKQVQDELKKEIMNLQIQVEESKQGLQAASRLSDQLEQSKHFVTTLKGEVAQYKEKLEKNEEQLKNVSSQTDGKVDKSLIKNLIIGFVSSNNNLSKDQTQILKIIATVLDFNQQDHDKVSLNKSQQGWLGSILSPQSTQGMSQESLSQAFVKFLETESKPRQVPSLLNDDATTTSRKTSTASSSGVRQSPSLLSEVVLPTFADFAQNRNSSSILKDVLKDHS